MRCQLQGRRSRRVQGAESEEALQDRVLRADVHPVYPGADLRRSARRQGLGRDADGRRRSGLHELGGPDHAARKCNDRQARRRADQSLRSRRHGANDRRRSRQRHAGVRRRNPLGQREVEQARSGRRLSGGDGSGRDRQAHAARRPGHRDGRAAERQLGAAARCGLPR